MDCSNAKYNLTLPDFKEIYDAFTKLGLPANQAPIDEIAEAALKQSRQGFEAVTTAYFEGFLRIFPQQVTIENLKNSISTTRLKEVYDRCSPVTPPLVITEVAIPICDPILTSPISDAYMYVNSDFATHKKLFFSASETPITSLSEKIPTSLGTVSKTLCTKEVAITVAALTVIAAVAYKMLSKPYKLATPAPIKKKIVIETPPVVKKSVKPTNLSKMRAFFGIPKKA